MLKTKHVHKDQCAKKQVEQGRHDCGQDRMTGQEMAVNAAVEASMRRFVKANQDNIRKSSKNRIASASYCGGIVDMIMIIRSALGKWAVEQLESWNKAKAEGKG